MCQNSWEVSLQEIKLLVLEMSTLLQKILNRVAEIFLFSVFKFSTL